MIYISLLLEKRDMTIALLTVLLFSALATTVFTFFLPNRWLLTLGLWIACLGLFLTLIPTINDIKREINEVQLIIDSIKSGLSIVTDKEIHWTEKHRVYNRKVIKGEYNIEVEDFDYWGCVNKCADDVNGYMGLTKSMILYNFIFKCD
ncbi:MAG: hypothetical protein CL489_08410 [Acidobacteria bacterium]|nr:hypothetical protein [Acidobacteriota bacterium]|tara:strand:- start:56700 stop:57143 length:444 start_codon:yes stop_codon:yes gene_type:complete